MDTLTIPLRDIHTISTYQQCPHEISKHIHINNTHTMDTHTNTTPWIKSTSWKSISQVLGPKKVIFNIWFILKLFKILQTNIIKSNLYLQMKNPFHPLIKSKPFWGSSSRSWLLLHSWSGYHLARSGLLHDSLTRVISYCLATSFAARTLALRFPL